MVSTPNWPRAEPTQSSHHRITTMACATLMSSILMEISLHLEWELPRRREVCSKCLVERFLETDRISPVRLPTTDLVLRRRAAPSRRMETRHGLACGRPSRHPFRGLLGTRLI